MDGAVIGLAFGIAFGRIGDLIIGDHLGKPTSWLLAFQYEGGNLSGFTCAAGTCRATLEGGQVLTITHEAARLTTPAGPAPRRGRRGPSDGPVRHVLRDVSCSWCCTRCRRAPRRLGVLTLVFGAVYGATRVLEDSLRVDKRVFGLTGSQWTGLTVSIVCIVTLIAWAVGARSSPRADDPDDDAGTRTRRTERSSDELVRVAVMAAGRHGERRAPP